MTDQAENIFVLDFDIENPTNNEAKRKCHTEKSKKTQLFINHKSKTTVDSFLMGAIKELYELNYMVIKKESRNLLYELCSCLTVESAKDVASNFAQSLTNNSDEYKNIYNSPVVNSFFSDAPIFKLLFADNCKNDTYIKLKNILNSNNTREQRILCSVMNMSYFDKIKTVDNAFKFINEDLENSGFDLLNSKNEFDSLIMKCIEDENRINVNNNLDFNIGGMRSLSKLLNGIQLSPEENL